LTSKVSRAALIAAIAVGASGLVAASADAAAVTTAGVSTANYYVDGPTVAGVSDLTPESAVLNGAVDTGGSPLTTLTVPAGQTLLWQNALTIGSLTSTAAQTFDVDGLPVSGSASTVSVTVNDAAVSANSQSFPAVSNGGADNYSNVTFEYDPLKDYVANGDTAGPETQFANEVEVPTTTGISSVSQSVGAFGIKAQNNSGNTPLTPGTTYVYWIVSQAGATDAAESINIAQWYDTSPSATPAGGSAASTTSSTSFASDPNPTYKCYPDAAIAEDPTLASYTSSTQITYGGTTAPAIQGPCVYFYGNTGGALYYTSPTGKFKTPALGKLKIAAKASVGKSTAVVTVTNASSYKAGGTIELTGKGGKELASGKFSVSANVKGEAKLKLTAAGKKLIDVPAKPGKKASNGHKATKGTAATVKTGVKTKLVLSSNFDQPTSTKSVTL
jgi:hypothetical protein